MAEKKRKQKMRYDKTELALLKSIFHENEDTLMALRKVFLFAPLNEEDCKLLNVISSNDTLMTLMGKTYFPEIELDVPVGQMIDLWLSVDTKEKTFEEVSRALLVRKRLMDLIKKGLERLADPTIEITENLIGYEPDFTMTDEKLYVEFFARNACVTHTEFQLAQIRALASHIKDETPKEAQKRLAKDSSK